MRRTIALAAAAALVACGGGADAPRDAEDDTGSQPNVDIRALDTLRFDPAAVRVEAGRRVTFIVTNAGANQHEFVVADAEYHEQVAAGEHEEGHGGALESRELAPGKMHAISFTFDEPGELVFACHEPGHYEGGMKGTINVEA